jgi:CelD/BcsL family acetyltransferase involved in cellulose biosynthesis
MSLAALEASCSGEVATSPAALERLCPEWLDLWSRSRCAGPFQSPAWLIPWWTHLGGGPLSVAAIRRGGRLSALAPFFRYEGDGAPRLLPFGIGITDDGDALFETAGDGEAAAAVIAALAEAAEGAAIELHELPPGSPLLTAPAPPGWTAEVAVESRSPVLALPSSMAALLQRLPRKLARDLRQAQRRCAAAGAIRVERADAASCDEIFSALTALHARRWQERGEAGVLADPAVQRFHRAALPRLAAAGILRVYALRLDGRIVAAFYGLACKGRHAAYLTGFDPGLARLSPGTVLLAHAIAAAIGEGLQSFDMLRGEESYKFAWGGVAQPRYRRRLSPAR